MPKIEQNAGWSCQRCTYDNFPASIKCALCKGMRDDCVLNEGANDDIEEERDSVTEDNDGSICSESSDSIDLLQGRWSCLSCTFLNWENSLKCAMCLNERPNDYIPQATTIDSLAKTQANISSKHVDNLTVNNNEKNKSNSIKNKQKWTCPQCTFENWNKSKRCSLCSFSKPKADESAILKTKNSQNVLNLKKSVRQRSRPAIGKSVATAIQPITSEAEEQLIYGLSATNISAVSQQYQIKNNLQEDDWMWLSACIGVVEGEPSSVKLFLSSGGSPARKLTSDEVLVLNRPGVFEVGDTLVHLGIRYHRDDLLAIMLPHEVSRKTFKRMPCHVSPDLAASVRKQAAQGLRQRKGDWPCYFYTDLVTFTLPGELQDFPGAVQQCALDEIADQNVQRGLRDPCTSDVARLSESVKTFEPQASVFLRFPKVEQHPKCMDHVILHGTPFVLEVESIINWSMEITNQLDSRVFALWNRSAGDCLLDSICQATWGVFDRENALRNALYVSLSEGASRFFPRWKEWEEMQATNMQFTLDEDQWEQDWASVLSLASQPGASLEQTHVFALAHIIRRPIIIYGVKFVRSFRGETLGLARFQGVYLPLLWEKSFCWKSPIVLGYTRGHFSALVAMETEQQHGAVGAGAHTDNSDESHMTYLPLVDQECKLLPVHFLNGSELGNEDQLLREWLDCHITNTGILVAEQRATPRAALVNQLMDDWLDRYRKMNKEMVTERRK